jgi:UPF0755 protein
LQEADVIRKENLFTMWLLLRRENVIVGDYLFETPQSLFRVASRVSRGDYGDSLIRVFLPEGNTIAQMVEILEDQIENFNTNAFERKAKDDEGFLFPDTYFFFPSADADNVYETLRGAFDREIEPFLPEIEASEHTLEEIITMASIIEKESFDDNTERSIISGILWKRISINMPLQVDAPFVYILGKGSGDLTRDDLQKKSPYNTYTNLGLPPGPIGNPGSASIRAALYPEPSPYLFYLHDKNGIVRYARTHDEHVRNKNLYLRQ